MSPNPHHPLPRWSTLENRVPPPLTPGQKADVQRILDAEARRILKERLAARR
jgi:hypothetical protein